MSVSVFGGIPTFFRALCREAAKQYCGMDYSHVGEALVGSLERLVPYDADDNEWDAEVEALYGRLERQEFAAALEWFTTRYPKCIARVPRRRRQKFLEGVYRGWLIDTGACDCAEVVEIAREVLRDRISA